MATPPHSYHMPPRSPYHDENEPGFFSPLVGKGTAEDEDDEMDYRQPPARYVTPSTSVHKCSAAILDLDSDNKGPAKCVHRRSDLPASLWDSPTPIQSDEPAPQPRSEPKQPPVCAAVQSQGHPKGAGTKPKLRLLHLPPRIALCVVANSLSCHRLARSQVGLVFLTLVRARTFPHARTLIYALVHVLYPHSIHVYCMLMLMYTVFLYLCLNDIYHEQ